MPNLTKLTRALARAIRALPVAPDGLDRAAERSAKRPQPIVAEMSEAEFRAVFGDFAR